MENIFFSKVVKRLEKELQINKVEEEKRLFGLAVEEDGILEFRIFSHSSTYEIEILKLERLSKTKENENLMNTVKQIMEEVANDMDTSCIMIYTWDGTTHYTTKEIEEYARFLEDSRRIVKEFQEKLREKYNLKNGMYVDGFDEKTLSVNSYEPREFLPLDRHKLEIDTFGTFQTLEGLKDILQELESEIKTIYDYTEQELIKTMKRYDMPTSFYKNKIQIGIFYYSHLESFIVVNNQNKKVCFCSFDSRPDKEVIEDMAIRTIYLEKIEEEFCKICKIDHFGYKYNGKNVHHVFWDKEYSIIELNKTGKKRELRFFNIFNQTKHLVTQLTGDYEEVLIELKKQTKIVAKRTRLKQIMT